MRRQIRRATCSGSPGSPSCSSSTGGPLPASMSEVDRRHADRCALVDVRTDAEVLLDLLLDLVGEVGVVPQEGADILLALAELVGLVGVPGAGLLDHALLDAHVDQRALAADA